MTLDEGKAYFLSFCGLMFHMFRESPEQYHLYKNLNISKEIEKQWCAEEIFKIVTEIVEILEKLDSDDFQHDLSVFKKIKEYIIKIDFEINYLEIKKLLNTLHFNKKEFTGSLKNNIYRLENLVDAYSKNYSKGEN